MEWHRNPPWMASQSVKPEDKTEQQVRGTNQKNKPDRQTRKSNQKITRDQQSKKPIH